MKIKGLTKLAMSGVALAAVAATLGTSTYAWYVVNAEATVSNVTASTKSNGDSSILVSKDGKNFSGKLEFTSNDFNGTGSDWKKDNVNKAMWPVATADGESFYELSQYTDADGTLKDTPTKRNDVLTFNVWVKSGDVVDITTKLSLVNKTGITETQTTAVLPTQYAYVDAGTGKAAESSFSIDAAQALKTKLTVADAAADSNGSTYYDVQSIATSDFSNAYSPLGDLAEDKVKSGKVVLDEAAGTESASLTGAHHYYASVMKEVPVLTSSLVTISSATTIGTITTAAANKAVKLTFTVWLDGTDTMCYDACGGQNFEFGLQFTAVKHTA